MKTRTRTENASLALMSKSAMEKIELAFNKERVDKSKLLQLGRYLGSKSPGTIAKFALFSVADAMLKPDQDLLDLVNYDKMGWIIKLKNKKKDAPDGGQFSGSAKDMIKISVPIWQITIIVSNANNILQSGEGIVLYSLQEALNRLNPVFGAGAESLQ